MPLDPSIILQAQSPQFQSPLAMASQAATLRQLGLQSQASQLGIEQSQRNLQQEKTLADLYRGNTDPTTGQVNQQGVIGGMASAGLGEKIPAYQQSLATAGKAQTEQQAAQFDFAKKRMDAQANSLAELASDPQPTYDKVNAHLQALVNAGLIKPEEGAAAMRDLPGPDQLHQYLVQKALGVMDASKRLELMTPKFEKVDTGGGVTTGSVDQLSGKFTPGATLPKSISPDTQANITKDYAVAGLNSDGTPGQANQALVKMIGEGRMIPSDRLESTPRGQAVLAEVEKQYPGYDVTTARAKQKAANDFGAGGKDGAALRFIGTATKHLDMLDGLVNNLDNTDSPAFNSVANFWKTQTGQAAPKTFDAAKQIVGQEVIKAIVAGGGGVGERQEAADALSKASSPAQLRGVIATYKTIMGAQHESLLQQRDAAGLPRSTLPDYTDGATNTSPLKAPGGPPVPIKSDADYNALKSGTRFLAPDGSTRVKP